MTPHDLRHFYASGLANAGMSLAASTALLGQVAEEDETIRYATLAPLTRYGLCGYSPPCAAPTTRRWARRAARSPSPRSGHRSSWTRSPG
jgi:hypothetical protein